MMFANGGLAMLLKSMGLDPEGLMRQFQGAAQEAQKVIQLFDRRLTAIELQIAELNRRLTPVISLTEPREPSKQETEETCNNTKPIQ